MTWLSDQLVAQTASLRNELDLLENIIQTLPSGFAYIDQDYVFRLVNPAFAIGCGRTVNDFVGRALGEVVPSVGKVLQPILAQVFSGKQTAVAQIVDIQLAPDKDPRRWDISAASLSDGVVSIGAVILVFDGTDRHPDGSPDRVKPSS